MKRIDTWTTSEGYVLPVYVDDRGRVAISTVQARRDRGVAEEELEHGRAPFASFSERDSASLIERLGYEVPAGTD